MLEDVYGGSWAVVIIKGTDIVGTNVSWMVPTVKHTDDSVAYCNYQANGWEYLVFKTARVYNTNSWVVVDKPG